MAFRAGGVKWFGLPLVHDLEWGADFLFLLEVEVAFQKKKVLWKYKMHAEKYTHPKGVAF